MALTTSGLISMCSGHPVEGELTVAPQSLNLLQCLILENSKVAAARIPILEMRFASYFSCDLLSLVVLGRGMAEF